MRENLVKMPPSSRRWSAAAALAAACSVAFLYISLNWIGVIDDAFIFFRYARHIREGSGYVFNVGQPVEGTTSVTWTLLLTGSDLLQIPAELSVKILGFLCVLGILVLLANEFRTSGTPSSIMLFVSALLVFHKSFVLSVMMGLETGLYALLLLGLCAAARWHTQRGGRSPGIVLGAVGVLLFLTRPESIVLLLLAGCGMIVWQWRGSAPDVRIPILIWALGIVAISLWRWFTFGDVVPNSVRAKAVFEVSKEYWSILWPRVAAGSIYIRKLLAVSWVPAVLGMLGLASVRKSLWGYVSFSALVTGVGVVLVSSGDWMPHSRLLTPYLPVVALLAGAGLDRLRLRIGTPRAQYLGWALVLGTLLLMVSAFWSLRDRDFFVAGRWSAGACYSKVGLVVQPYLPKDALVAPEAVGELGYTLMGVEILDFFGLTDPYIARHGVIPIETYSLGKHHYQYVMQRKPTLFLFHSDLVNHIPLLAQWGYAEEYVTFRIADAEADCSLLVGVMDSLVPVLAPVLDRNFTVQPVDISQVQKNPAATWPEGER